jgi:hypothetical protein
LLIYSVLILLLLITPKNTYALSKADTRIVETMINTAIRPINTAITNIRAAALSLKNRVTDVETNIAGMLDRLIAAESSINSIQLTTLNLQNRVVDADTITTGILDRVATSEANIASNEVKLTDFGNRINNLENAGPDFQPPVSWLPIFSSTNRTLTIATSKTDKCNWNGVSLTQQVQVRGTAHFPGLDSFAVGNCDVIVFTNIVNYPPPGTNISVDLNLFWQEKIRHVQLNLTVI